MTGESLQRQGERLRRAASEIARPLASAAASRTTPAQERAILRMFGVDGLDRAGRPLASSVVESYCSGDPSRLELGIALPFAVALSAYELEVRDAALEIASGAIDLAVEAQELLQPDRRDAASDAARRLILRALARFDENRTASRELREVLGEPAPPWLGMSLAADDWQTAADEACRCVEDGVGLVRVRVPASWELVEARRDAQIAEREEDAARGATGRRFKRVRPHDQEIEPDHGPRGENERPPAGSQRGLARVRGAADEAAAERASYASLMTVTSALAAPEQAVVAALERIDFVEADPLREIVEGNVDPDRALADHAFAHRLDARSGRRLFVGSGPLALGPEVATGVPAGRGALASRALALQAISVEFALANGISPAALVVGAVPTWLATDGDPTTTMAEAWLRGVVFADHPLALEEPTSSVLTAPPYELVAALVAVALPNRSATMMRETPLLFLRKPLVEPERGRAAAELASAARSAGALRHGFGSAALHGSAAALAESVLDGAIDVLARFGSDGWSAVLGRGFERDSTRIGARGVVERSAGATLLDAISGATAAGSEAQAR